MASTFDLLSRLDRAVRGVGRLRVGGLSGTVGFIKKPTLIGLLHRVHVGGCGDESDGSGGPVPGGADSHARSARSGC